MKKKLVYLHFHLSIITLIKKRSIKMKFVAVESFDLRYNPRFKIIGIEVGAGGVKSIGSSEFSDSGVDRKIYDINLILYFICVCIQVLFIPPIK